MKRSEIFLALTSIIFALVGVAATKRHQADVIGYYSLGAGMCTNVAPPLCTDIKPAGVGQCTYNDGIVNHKLFTFNDTGGCINVVWKDPS